MLVRGVSGDEDAAVAVLARHHDAQVPEADVVKLDLELEARGFLQQAVEVEVVRLGVGRHRRMEEEALSHVDAAEELPVTLHLRLEHSEGRTLREALEAFVE